MLTRKLLLMSANLCCKHSSKISAPISNDLCKSYVLYWPQNRFLSSNNSNKSSPEKHIKIYDGFLTSRMKAVKVFSLTTSLTGLAAQPILMEQGAKFGGTPMAIFLCGFVGFFTFVTPVLLHFITKKYVTEIHYNPMRDEYTATTLSLILHRIETKFKTSDVKVPDVPGMFTSFVVGKTPLFVDPSSFTDTEHYVKIMGYDKPIDFKLNSMEDSIDKSKTKNNKTNT